MKDLTKYIESLLDGINNTCEVKYVDNIYMVIVIRDYSYSVVMYKNMIYDNHNVVMNIKKILKVYLPKSLYEIRVKEINVPISFQTMQVNYNL